MWYYDSEIIKTPRTMVISGITHPPGIFKDSSMLSSLGIKPYTETKPLLDALNEKQKALDLASERWVELEASK